MNRDVMISISGIQYSDGGEVSQKTELSADGLYYCKNGRHYIFYEEKAEGFEEAVKTRLRFGEGLLEITRSGPINVRMCFEENKMNMADYGTPFGNIALGIVTEKIDISETEDEMEIKADYSLEADGMHLSDCNTVIKVINKDVETST